MDFQVMATQVLFSLASFVASFDSVLPSSSGVFLRRIPRVLWHLSRTFFALVMPWVFATPTSSRRRRRLMIPSPSPPSLDSFDGRFSALGFRRRRVPRAPFLSPTPLPVAFPSKRRFAPAIGPVQAPSIVTTFVHLARLWQRDFLSENRPFYGRWGRKRTPSLPSLPSFPPSSWKSPS